jgi:ADP-ribose 1''-phosphate phosphatase
MALIYKQGDLFKAEGNVIFTHACNCQGRWGRGIALQFKERYPQAYEVYQDVCQNKDVNPLGRSLVIKDGDDLPISCLFTSSHYSPPDSPEEIAANTLTSALELIKQVPMYYSGYEIHSPKINAGLFKVPWAKTENVILEALQDTDVTWVVWEYEI